MPTNDKEIRTSLMQKKSPTYFPRGHKENLLHGKSGSSDIAQVCWKRKCVNWSFKKIFQLHRHWQLNNDWRPERRNLRRLSQRPYKTWYFFLFYFPTFFFSILLRCQYFFYLNSSSSILKCWPIYKISEMLDLFLSSGMNRKRSCPLCDEAQNRILVIKKYEDSLN